MSLSLYCTAIFSAETSGHGKTSGTTTSHAFSKVTVEKRVRGSYIYLLYSGKTNRVKSNVVLNTKIQNLYLTGKRSKLKNWESMCQKS